MTASNGLAISLIAGFAVGIALIVALSLTSSSYSEKTIPNFRAIADSLNETKFFLQKCAEEKVEVTKGQGLEPVTQVRYFDETNDTIRPSLIHGRELVVYMDQKAGQVEHLMLNFYSYGGGASARTFRDSQILPILENPKFNPCSA